MINVENDQLSFKETYSMSYLTPVVIHVRVACVNVGGHVEILRREHGLLLLHIHAATLDQSVSSELQKSNNTTERGPVRLQLFKIHLCL